MRISIRFTFEKLLMLKMFTKILFVHSTNRMKVSKYCQLSCTESTHMHTHTHTRMHTHTQPYYGPLSGTTRVRQYQKKNTHPATILINQSLSALPYTTIHSILPLQIMCLAIFLHNLCPCLLWSTSWSGALHLIFHTFLHPISVFFSQYMPIPWQPVLL